MDRQELEQLIHDVVLGRADEDAAGALERETARDAELRRTYEFASALRREAERSAKPEVDAAFTRRVMSAVRARGGRRVLSADFLSMTGRFALSVAVHAAILLILAFVILHPGVKDELPSVVSLTGCRDKAVAERREARQVHVMLDEGWLDLSGFGVGDTIYVLRGRAGRYHLLMAYTAEQLSRLDAATAEGAVPFPVRNGRVRLSRSLVAEGLGGASEVVLLALSDRFEIWNARDFERFISAEAPPAPAALL